MPLTITQSATVAAEAALHTASHTLFILPVQEPAALPYRDALYAKLQRQRSKYEELAKSPVAVDLANGGLASFVVLDITASSFKQLSGLRKAIQLLLDEEPSVLTIAVYGEEDFREQAAAAGLYVAEVNAAVLPTHKTKDEAHALESIHIHGWARLDEFAETRAIAAGNILSRQLTMLPPNVLNPTIYREKIAMLAQENGWGHEEFNMQQLREMGAGAFVAVGQGSEPEDAAIVHLTYEPDNLAPDQASPTFALVGKGICFDTGGHNLKPARYMTGMHEDMNGSAVALGILLAATQNRFPARIDCWLAVAQNHIGPKAYKQNDIITAMNGTTIEIVHTDAEGRMVLADTLTLASRAKPDLMIDFATLTGTMISALADRYCGLLGNRPNLLAQAVETGATVGERICAFPFDEDYEEELESDVADIKQCSLEPDADHILAARFLAKFIENDVPWLHLDLSASRRKGGLGAVSGEVTGFGVSWAYALLKSQLNPRI